MVEGLNINRLVRVSVNLSPLAASRRGFGVLLVAGDSNVIDPVERLRSYADIESVAQDFGTTAPEYYAAQLYFGQSPKPTRMMIGRWVRTATSGILKGGILTATEQLLANWTSITNGALTITIDGGTVQVITGLDFSAQTNLNGVAAVIDAALAGASVVWNGQRFVVSSSTTGPTSSVGYAAAALTGTDIGVLAKLNSTTALAPIPGFAVETAVDAVSIFADMSGGWYGLLFSASTMPDSNSTQAVAEFIEAANLSRIFGVTETDTRVLDSSYTADYASVFKGLGLKRTFVTYSQNPRAAASIFGRAFSVNFAANKSTITIMYKQEPGVVPELLTNTQADTLKTKRCNVFVRYQNDTAIVQYGVMSGPAYIDEIHGLDWLSDAIQNAAYNLLYQSQTKIPQTDAGQNEILNTIAGVCQEGINNGLIAPGQWNADGFGQLQRGQYLTDGFYIYSPPIALQNQATREQRIAPPIQVAAKLAGAVHEIDVIVNVNR
jgi:hypothetical protein